MPQHKDLKRIIRTRMKKTGESYTAARARVIASPKAKQTPPRTVDHAALAGMSDEKVAAQTGRTWEEWTRVLDADNAAAMRHRDIAKLVHEKHGVREWWTQTVTVGYERIKGLRDRGQRRDGSYEAGRSRTFDVPVNALFDAWVDDTLRGRWLDGIDAQVRTATRPKTVRLQWPDGTVVIAGFIRKGNAKSSVAVAHTKLADRPSLEKTKKYWTDRLDALGRLLAIA